MVKLVAALRARIPSLVNAFKHGHPVAGSREIENLMRLADTLARGETPSAPPRRATTAATVEQPLAPHEVSARLERCMQRADEALHRSEMALQQARRLSALIEDPQRERPRSGVGRDIEETRQTDTTRHRVAWLRLVLSALVGGLIATALLLSLPYLG
jgi:tRNA A37 methylthiotransferase MiaB